MERGVAEASVAHRDPPAQQGPEWARLPSMPGVAGTPWPGWTAAPQGPGKQGMALGRVPVQEQAPEHVCLSRVIWTLLLLLPTLLWLCPLLLGLLLATQPQWEPALAAAPAGSPGQGPAIKRPVKTLGSLITLSRIIWTTQTIPKCTAASLGVSPISSL